MSGLVVISVMTLYNEKTDVWAAYTTEDGLASNKVTTIGVDGTEVWIGTYNAGVSRFDQLTRYLDDLHTEMMVWHITASFPWLLIVTTSGSVHIAV